jgi:hypothetical protein
VEAAPGHHLRTIDPATWHNSGLVGGECGHRPKVADPLRDCYAFPQYDYAKTTNFIDLVALNN